MFTLIGSLALAALPLAAPTLGEGAQWHADFDEAVKVARAENKDLLVDFTGSDWCVWCIRLDDEVFKHAEFLDEIQKKYVLVALDFPNDEEIKAKVPNPERNDELRAKYEIQGFPTVLLMSPDGVVFGETGYQKGGPEKYVAHVTEIADSGRKVIAEIGGVVDAFRAAETPEAKIIAMGAVLEFLRSNDGSPRLMAPALEVAREAFVLDPANEAGLLERATEILLERDAWSPEVAAAAAKVDPDNAKGMIERSLRAQMSTVSDEASARVFSGEILAFVRAKRAIKDNSEVALMAAQAAFWNADPELLNDSAIALELAKASLEMDPEGRAAEKLTELVESHGTGAGEDVSSGT